MMTTTRQNLLALLAAAVVLAGAGCATGEGNSVAFGASPNRGGGTPGTVQAGGTSTALLRFVQGSPDVGSIDICIDNLPPNVTAPTVAYGTASANLASVAGGITHTIAVFSTVASSFGSVPGSECATAPGPYFGSPPIAVTTIGPGIAGNPARETIVLAGTAATKTLGLFVFGEPNFASAPPANTVVSHNAAPAFSATSGSGVGFGYVPAGGAATNLSGASNVGAPQLSTPTLAVINTVVQSPIAAVPASFYDGKGTAGTVVPLKTVTAPAQTATPYVVELYAIDAPGNALGLVAVQEAAVGSGV